MEKFLIILLPEKLYVYKSIDNNEFDVFYVNGEEVLNWSMETYSKDFMDLKEEILDIYNFDDLSEIGFNVIYHKVDTDVIKQLSDTLLPCEYWQVFSFEKVLPELLLKMKKIKPTQSIGVTFDDTNYVVAMDEKGFIESCISQNKGELNVDIEMIPSLLSSCYEFITNEQEIINKDKDITELKDRMYLVEKLLKQKVDEVNKKSQELIEKDNTIITLKRRNDKNKIIGKRNIIRVIKPTEMLRVVPAIGLPFLNTKSEKKLKLKWCVNNGAFVNANNEIAEIQSLYSDGSISQSVSIKSEISGRLFILVDDSEVKEGQEIAVVSDPSDSIEDIRQWIREIIISTI